MLNTMANGIGFDEHLPETHATRSLSKSRLGCQVNQSHLAAGGPADATD